MITISMNLLTILAQAAPTTPAPAPSSPFGGIMIPAIIIMVIFMFFSVTSKRKQEKARQAQLSAMKRGDRVQTIGGILGTIVEVRDTEVVVKVDETNNTKIKFARSAVSRVTVDEDKDKDKDKEKADAK